MELGIKTIEEIKDIIDRENKEIAQKMAFSNIIDFPFPELYKEIVIKYNTMEISTNCLLYNYVKAKEETEKNYEILKNYWVIGEAGFNYWVMDKNGIIYYWRKVEKEVITVNINFGQWLQFAYLDKDYDENTYEYESMYEGDYDKEKFKEYINKLKEISIEISEYMFNVLY